MLSIFTLVFLLLSIICMIFTIKNINISKKLNKEVINSALEMLATVEKSSKNDTLREYLASKDPKKQTIYRIKIIFDVDIDPHHVIDDDKFYLFYKKFTDGSEGYCIQSVDYKTSPRLLSREELEKNLEPVEGDNFSIGYLYKIKKEKLF